MKLEELIYSRISGAEYGTNKLAIFDGEPAIFFGPCPEDSDRGWGDRRQYPRISYGLDLRGDPERQTAGTLFVDVWCTEDGPAPEDIEPTLRRVLCGVIMAPTDENPCSFSWQASQTFQSNRETKTDKVIGVTVTFDMIAFPEQITSDPDPVLAMMKYIREEYPEITVIGQDTLPDFTEPSEEHPAIYFRLDSYEVGRETFTVAWLEGTVVAHLFAPGASIRQRWIRALVDDLACRGEVIMLDTSPMFLRRIAADNTLDPLSSGQIRLGATWGVLKRPKYAHRINHIHVAEQQKPPPEPKHYVTEYDRDVPVEITGDSSTGTGFDYPLCGESNE